MNSQTPSFDPAPASLGGAWIDAIRPTRRRSALLFDIASIAVGSMVVALCAQVAFRVPVSIVPITLQTFAVLTVGCALGSRRGAWALALYLTQGIAGLPVFAEFSFGPHHLFGPTGGYLLGFIPAAWFAGRWSERGWDRTFARSLVGLTAATGIIFALGLIWLAVYQLTFSAVAGASTTFSIAALLVNGLWPFLPGAALKILAAALVLPRAATIRE